MIVPMKHLTLLCVASAREATVARLSELGVLDVEITRTDTEAIGRMRQGVEVIERAISVVRMAAKTDWQRLTIKPGATLAEGVDVPPAVAEIVGLAEDYLRLQEHAHQLETQRRAIAPWGDFDLELVNRLIQSGVSITFVKVPCGLEAVSVESGYYERLSSDLQFDYGILVNGMLPEGWMPQAVPTVRLCEVNTAIETKQTQIRTCAEKLAQKAVALPELERLLEQRQAAHTYVTVSENVRSEGAVAYLTGFCDARQVDLLKTEAQTHGWGLSLRDPEPEESVPTLLEPPRFFRPILSLFSALGITPGYTETDVSVPFYCFFTLFFAMLIGDAGYGAIIVGLALWAHKKAIQKAGTVKLEAAKRSIFTLLYLFGGATIVWGILTGTYFAIDVQCLPTWLQFKSVDFLAQENHIMQLCFTLGAIHLGLARLWNAMHLFPNKKFLAELGWFGVIWSMYLVVCGIVVAGFQYPKWGIGSMAISVLLIACFMVDVKDLKKEGVSLGMLPLNVISSMGDIISYVRLYAVSLASVKVAGNFNEMATGMDLPMIFKLPLMILILLLGHGINFAMGGLSILVHAVRLNTLEFSGAKGVTWCGRPFKPFRSTISRVSPDGERTTLSSFQEKLG